MSEAQVENGVETPSRKQSSAKEKQIGSFEKPIDLDDVLVNELGQFGRYQLRNFLLVAIPIMSASFVSDYIFTAAAIPHRCRIPECGEGSKLGAYEPEWVLNAIPDTNSGFSSCQRYGPSNTGLNGTFDYCPANLFNPMETVPCDGFVYARDDTVVYDFDLGCEEWLRALAGTLSSLGTLLVLPITGYVSDRYGRKFALIISVFNFALIGLIRVFSVNYTMYLVLQLLQTTLGAGTFSSAFILVTELVGPKYRVITGATSNAMFAVGQVVLGGLAWILQSWKYLIMALNIPYLFVIGYYWILSESVRWLLSEQKYEEARKVLKSVARINNKVISEKSLNALMNPPQQPLASEDIEKPGLIRSIRNSPILLRRVCTTPIWWITATFVYFGLNNNSTSLSDNIYLNFILAALIEIPGFFTAVLALNRVGRKATLSSGFFFSALCNIVFIFIPSDLNVLRIIVFLLGKFGIASVMTSVYLFTSELYPTEYRHSLLGFSSMIGRIGSIVAPLTPILSVYWHGIPSMMFAIMGIISGLLVLTQPETLGTTMPDTLAEAEALGRNK